MKKYQVILADYPWPFRCWSKKGSAKRSAESHYRTLPLEEGKLLKPQIGEWCDDNCALFMWGTWPTLIECIAMAEAWGFKYKTCAFVWAKLTSKWHDRLLSFLYKRVMTMAAPLSGLESLFHFGMGYYTRANTEYCLMFYRGKIGRFENKSIRQLVLAPIREHSRKPDEVHERICLAYPDENRIEMFAREKRDGWDVWGNETDKFNQEK